MLKKITREEATKIIEEESKKGSGDNVVICNGMGEKSQWYDIRGLSMEQVGNELMKMAEGGVLKE